MNKEIQDYVAVTIVPLGLTACAFIQYIPSALSPFLITFCSFAIAVSLMYLHDRFIGLE